MCHKVVDRSWEFTVLRQEIPKRRLSVLRWGRLRRSSHADPTLNWDPGPAQGGSPGPRATPPTRPLPPGALSLGNSASGRRSRGDRINVAGIERVRQKPRRGRVQIAELEAGEVSTAAPGTSDSFFLGFQKGTGVGGIRARRRGIR